MGAELLPRNGTVALRAAPLVLFAFLCTQTACAQDDIDDLAWINEFHYDSVSNDFEEFIEIVLGPDWEGDLEDINLTLYDGASGLPTSSFDLTAFTEGETISGYTFYFLEGTLINTPSYCMSGTLINSYSSYEGVVVALGGPCDGLTSEDYGISEDENTPVGSSIALEGSGASLADFVRDSWTLHNNPAGGLGATKGTVNHNQVLIHPTNAFAGLTLSKGAPAGPIAPGSNIIYTITVTNAGPFSATSVRVDDTLPAGFAFASATPSQGFCAISNHTVTCFLLTIPPGTNATVAIEATAVLGGTFTNRATVTATRPDSNLTDNVATTETTVMLPVDTDGDGMPDWWEEKHQAAGLNPAISNAPTSDVDSDGVPDIEEYNADTNPGRMNDYFSIKRIVIHGPTNTVQFDSSAARRYTGATRTDLNTGPWTNFTDTVPGTGGPLSLTDTNPAPHKFYRVGAGVP